MQTTASVKSTTLKQNTYSWARSHDHELLNVHSDACKYGAEGGIDDPLEYKIKPNAGMFHVCATPPALLMVQKGASTQACTFMTMGDPEPGYVLVGTMGNVRTMATIMEARREGDNILMRLSLDRLNYSQLIGSPIPPTAYSLEGEYIYFLFGNYSENKVYLENVGKLDENGNRYEYVDDGTMLEYYVMSASLPWERTGTLATITQVGHGYRSGATIRISRAISNGNPSKALPDGEYVIQSVTEDTFDVACLDEDITSGIVDVVYKYGDYQRPPATIVAKALQRCINALFDDDKVTVKYLDGRMVITSLIAGVQLIGVPEDYESVSSALGLSSGKLYPAKDMTGAKIYADGMSMRDILDASHNTMVVSGDGVDVEALPGTKAWVLDTDKETTITVMIA